SQVICVLEASGRSVCNSLMVSNAAFRLLAVSAKTRSRKPLQLGSRHLRTAIRQGLKRSGENTSTSCDSPGVGVRLSGHLLSISADNGRPSLILSQVSIFLSLKTQAGPVLSRLCLIRKGGISAAPSCTIVAHDYQSGFLERSTF